MAVVFLNLRDEQGVWHHDIQADFNVLPRVGENIRYFHPDPPHPHPLDHIYDVIMVVHEPNKPAEVSEGIYAVYNALLSEGKEPIGRIT